MPDYKKSRGLAGELNGNSVFSAIAPQSPAWPAPAPEVPKEQITALKDRLNLLEKNLISLVETKLAGLNSAPHVPVPAVTTKQITALEARIDLLEKNLTATVETKLAGLNPAPSASPEQVAELNARIEAIAKNIPGVLADNLSRQAAAAGAAAEKRTGGMMSVLAGLVSRLDALKTLGAAHAGEMKNYRLEVKSMAAELPKVLEEERKKRDEDIRLLQDQAKRSMSRSAELERKLDETRRTCEDGFLQLRDSVIAVGARNESSVKEGGINYNARADELDKKVSALTRNIDTLRSQEEASLQAFSEAAAKISSLEKALSSINLEEYSVHLRELGGELATIRHAHKEQAEHFWEKVSDFSIIAEGFEKKAKALEQGLDQAINGNKRTMESALENVGLIVDKALERFMTDLQEKNREQFARLSANYAGALATLRQIGTVCSSIEYVSKRLGGYENTLVSLVTQVGGDRLSSLTGVSGVVIREKFAAIEVMAAEFKREKEQLDAARKEISEKTRSVMGESGSAA